LDTAGIHDSSEPIEQEGMRRARERAAAADIVLWVVDANAAGQKRAMPDLDAGASDIWRIGNKIDLIEESPFHTQKDKHGFTYLLSAEQGQGIEALEAGLVEYAKSFFAAAESTLVTRARHRRAFEETVAALDRAVAEGNGVGREELVAEELRSAASVLGRLTGRVDVEDILDVIFRDFCIGK
jgi:tRNA modification GTPase